MHYTAPARLVEEFSVFVSPEIEDEKIDMVRGALVIARTEYPELDIEEYAGRIERMARRAAATKHRKCSSKPSRRCGPSSR